uniref:Glutamate-rich protein 2 n=1 Tax=Salvator merianae TaxID=96440 RepID=A0A8D0BXT2_SALMN
MVRGGTRPAKWANAVALLLLLQSKEEEAVGRSAMNRLSIVVGQGLPKPTATKVCGMMEVIAPKEVIIEHGETVSRRNALVQTGRSTDSKMSVKLHDCVEEVEEEEEEEVHHNQQLRTDLQRLNHEIKIIETRGKSEVNDEEMKISQEVEKTTNHEVSNEPEKDVDRQNADEKSSDSSDDENYEQSDNVIEKRVAPLQLMGEFLKAIMEKKYSLAKKLCQMILIYEPENPEAKQFLPLIEQKLLLERERQNVEGEESGEASSDDSEEDTSDTDESEASSEDSDKNS